jgi:hypothetical protein
VRELAELVQTVRGLIERLVFNPTQIGRIPGKLLDILRIKGIERSRIRLREPLAAFYETYEVIRTLLRNQRMDAARVAG